MFNQNDAEGRRQLIPAFDTQYESVGYHVDGILRSPIFLHQYF